MGLILFKGAEPDNFLIWVAAAKEDAASAKQKGDKRD